MNGHADDDFDLAETIAASERDDDPETDERTGRAAAAQRIEQQQSWVDHQLRVAMERGDFDDLPGAGKPLPPHDEMTWVRRLVEREGLSADPLLPPTIRLRKELDRLPQTLAELRTEAEVRAEVAELNRRVVAAIRAPVGPPVRLGPVDVESALARWRELRRPPPRPAAPTVVGSVTRRRWWRRSRSA